MIIIRLLTLIFSIYGGIALLHEALGLEKTKTNALIAGAIITGVITGLHFALDKMAGVSLLNIIFTGRNQNR